ncbi:MAG: UvrD-helicase domain-containing protein [Bacteroidales bacterium]
MLTVYRASAGSGKTYQLTGEYLKLLFSSNGSFRRILAVTFTNKATDEMKSRIIQELDKLAKGEESGYLPILAKEFSLSEELVRQKAHRILLEILHDYSSFNISTIDRFFQQTMRAFAREIGLQGGYNVELDTTRVLTEAVDKMLLTLDASENKELLSWLLRFSEEKIEDGKSWNFKKEVVDLGSELFKEKYKRLSSETHQKLGDKESLHNYLKKINFLITDFESKLETIGKEGLSLMSKAGFEFSDFSGGATKSPMKPFVKWANKDFVSLSDTFRKLADNIDDWKAAGKSKHLDAEIKIAYQSGLNDCVKRAIAQFEDYFVYNSAKIVRRNIYSLGILADIDTKIKEIVAENNLMLLSDTTHLLNRLIDGSDTPFIYEKIGVRIDHYMIDEFQDTSAMQWQNFSPLIRESLSSKDPEHTKLSNLIVGDVKQSIYRWRSSDWKLLDEQLGLEFSTQIHDEVLADNWRSGFAIVGFNNAFFTLASKLLSQKFSESIPDDLIESVTIHNLAGKIINAYKDVYQFVPKAKQNTSGRVKAQWFDSKTWKEEVLFELPKVVENWQSKGYALRDMAVLVRTKDEGATIADKLLESGVAVISDEALLLKNASPIKLIVALLNLLRRPNDPDLKRLAMIEYVVRINPIDNPVGDFFQTVANSALTEFPTNIATELELARRMPLYEMCERLISAFIESPTETDNLYLQTFQDMVLEFSSRKTADLIAFLDWWEESGSNKRVTMPDSQDAVRIMTIHKSKGLGFKAVIIPFCDWEIDQKPKSLLWCAPEVAPFNELPLLPVAYTKDLADSIFAPDYFDEKLHAYVDNLNLAYVAFTRAKEELVIFAPKPKNESISSLGSLLFECVCNSSLPSTDDKPFIQLTDHFDANESVYENDAEWMPKISSENSCLEESAMNIRSINPDGRLQLKLRSRDFFIDSEEQKYGKLMHYILSRIHTSIDIQNAVTEVVNAGEITTEKGAELSAKLVDWIAQDHIKLWFSEQAKVLNEVEILLPDGAHYRPDRVVFINDEVHVIDFKFGQTKAKKYQRQVSTYTNLIFEMGYNSVKGFLWFVELNEVESVF